MKKQLSTRLQDLKAEYKKGEERLTGLENEIANVRTSMLRISGAVQVLEEILEEKDKENGMTKEDKEIKEILKK